MQEPEGAKERGNSAPLSAFSISYYIAALFFGYRPGRTWANMPLVWDNIWLIRYHLSLMWPIMRLISGGFVGFSGLLTLVPTTSLGHGMSRGHTLPMYSGCRRRKALGF